MSLKLFKFHKRYCSENACSCAVLTYSILEGKQFFFLQYRMADCHKSKQREGNIEPHCLNGEHPLF